MTCTNPADGHLVGGEGASLVGADDRRAAERLDRRQTAHDRVLLRHTTSSERQTRGDDSRQTFRDSGNGQRYGDLEVVDGTLHVATASIRRPRLRQRYQCTTTERILYLYTHVSHNENVYCTFCEYRVVIVMRLVLSLLLSATVKEATMLLLSLYGSKYTSCVRNERTSCIVCASSLEAFRQRFTTYFFWPRNVVKCGIC